MIQRSILPTYLRKAAASACCAILGLGVAAAQPAFADPPAVPPAAVAPGTAAASPSTSAPLIDEKAMAFLAKVETTMAGLKSYQAECWTTFTWDGSDHADYFEWATYTALKPNLMFYEWWHMKVDANGVWSKMGDLPYAKNACDGKVASYKIDHSNRTKDNFNMNALYTDNFELWEGFFSPSMCPRNFAEFWRSKSLLIEVSDAGADSVAGTPVEKFYIRYKGIFGQLPEQEYKETWYIAADGLVHRKTTWQKETAPGKTGYTTDAILRSIKINAPVDPDSPLFKWTIPPGTDSNKHGPPPGVRFP